jgi:hypothetical protein
MNTPTFQEFIANHKYSLEHLTFEKAEKHIKDNPDIIRPVVEQAILFLTNWQKLPQPTRKEVTEISDCVVINQKSRSLIYINFIYIYQRLASI